MAKSKPSKPEVTFITADHDKGRHAVDVFRRQYNAAKLAPDEAQRFNDATSELKRIIDAFIAKVRVPEDFATEEVTAAYGYPSGHVVLTVPRQIDMLLKIFPGLDATQAFEFAKSLPNELPTGADGWFAIPKVSAIARIFFADVVDEAERYCAAINFVLGKIGHSRAITNLRSGQITKDRIRQRARDKEMLATAEASQPGDIVIIAAQLGKHHGGRSVRRARAVFVESEFGLGSFHVGCVLLTHPKRLQKWEELDMDCPGDEFRSDVGDPFGKAPVFVCSDDAVEFDTNSVDDPLGRYGSASGFLPQRS